MASGFSFRVWGLGFRVPGLGLLWFKVLGLGFSDGIPYTLLLMVEAIGCPASTVHRVSGFRVQALGFRAAGV